MKPSELHEKSLDELRDFLVEQKKRMFDLRLRQASGETVDPHQFRTARKDTARVRTILNQYRIVTDKTGLDEDTARKMLNADSWNVHTVIKKSLIQQVKESTDAEEDLIRESLASRQNSRQLAIDAIRISRIVPPGKAGDPKSTFKSFRRLRRDGFHLCGRYRQASESLLSEATGADAKLIRMALADSTYDLEKAEAIINITRRVASESGVSEIRGLMTLEESNWREKLAISRLKARANKIKKKVKA